MSIKYCSVAKLSSFNSFLIRTKLNLLLTENHLHNRFRITQYLFYQSSGRWASFLDKIQKVHLFLCFVRTFHRSKQIFLGEKVRITFQYKNSKYKIGTVSKEENSDPSPNQTCWFTQEPVELARVYLSIKKNQTQISTNQLFVWTYRTRK